MVESGRFASQYDIDRIPDYERLMIARHVSSFYYDLPDEYKRPFNKSLDFHNPKEDEWEALNGLLDNSERMDAVLAEMQRIFTNTPEEDRYYERRRIGFQSLSAYREGTFTLFPGLENLPVAESFEALLHDNPLNSGFQVQKNNGFTEISNPAILAEIDEIFGEGKPQPVAQKLYEEESQIGNGITAYYFVHYPEETDVSAALSHETLALITEPSDTYVISADACYLSESELSQHNIGFRKMPRDWNLLPVIVQERLRAIKPEYEREYVRSILNSRGFLPSEDNLTAWIGDYREFRVQRSSEAYDIEGFIEKGAAHDITVTGQPEPIAPRPAVPAGANFRITDDHLGEGGAKTKFRNNTMAINTLKTIESENRAATADEQETLSRYVGWGGLPQAFDPDNPQWRNECAELKALLADEEYESARTSRTPTSGST